MKKKLNNVKIYFLSTLTKSLLFFKNNKGVTVLLFIYFLVMISVIQWGIPNTEHPFTYHMDEWHQLSSIKAIVQHGSPNVPGAAHGPLFHFLLSGAYLVPFVLLGIINPFVVESPFSDLLMQTRIFEVLRFNTLLFGVASIILVAKIAKEHFNSHPLLAAVLFTITPIWLSLSNYFKYDIAFLFWIMLSLYFLFEFGKKKKYGYFLGAGITTGLSLAIKISALPLLVSLVVAFLLYRTPKQTFSNLFYGFGAVLITFLIVGIPDVFLGRGDYSEFFYSNLVSSPNSTANYIFGMSWWEFLLTNQMPTLFGHIFFSFFAASCIYFLAVIVINRKKMTISQRNNTLLLSTFILFLLSILTLKIYATGNRSLVLLPFFTIMTSYALSQVIRLFKHSKRILVFVLLVLAGSMQFVETLAWLQVKWSSDSRQTSSHWLQKNIEANAIIGIENIPIYQMLPDIVVKEYYGKEYDNKLHTNYRYQIVTATDKSLPKIIVITNKEETLYTIITEKKALLARLQREGYVRTAYFTPDWRLYSLFNNQMNFSIANIVPAPTVSIYSK